MAFITNFQSPKELDELVERYHTPLQLTNLDMILAAGSELGDWTVDRDALAGDRVYFMCAKTSVNHMGHVCAEARRHAGSDIVEYAEAKRQLYRKFAGKIVGVGKLSGQPYRALDSGWAHAGWKSPWYANIADFRFLPSPVDIADFRHFITISRTGAITRLDAEQDDCLRALIARSNPGCGI